KGGLSRIASYADSTRIRYGEPVIVDAGDFSGAAEYEGGKGPFIAEQFARIGYDAVTVGEREFIYGYALFKEQAKKLKVPVVLANLRDKATGSLVGKPH